jgi:hypothetical protein
VGISSTLLGIELRVLFILMLIYFVTVLSVSCFVWLLVRYAAANTAGQMSTDFGPKLQKKYHQQYVEGLAYLLDDGANPKYASSRRWPENSEWFI